MFRTLRSPTKTRQKKLVGPRSRRIPRILTAVSAVSVIVGVGVLAGVPSARANVTASPSAPGTVSSSPPASAPEAAPVASAAPDGLFPFTTVTGKVYMSEDAIGTNDPTGGPIYVQKNDSSATVQAAYLLAAGTPGYTMQNGDVTLDGTSLSFAPADSVVGNFGVNSVWTDVTSIVKPVVDAAPVGNVEFTSAEPMNTTSIDGEILAVVMNDPTLPTNNTVSFLFGALDTTGDSFSIGLANPINLSDPNLALTMSIGDSFGYQGPPATGQYSTISVNGNLMTSSAGGNDDSICKYDSPQDFANCGNGTLITAGGIGDGTANPPDPTATDSTCGPPGPPRCDDELYNLLPFVQNGNTSIQVNTDNPSNNDNIFFTGFQLNSAAAVVGEGAVLTPVSGTSPVGSPYPYTCKVQDDLGNPIVGQSVTFDVVSGPDAGTTGTATTDSGGDATFSLTGASVGTDTVECSFTDVSGNSHTSNQATVDWTSPVTPQPTNTSTSLSGGGQSGTSISVPTNTAVTDSATLSGTNAATATGTVTYNVYSDSACTTLVNAGSAQNITTPGSLPVSNPVTLTTAGTYYWQAVYSGGGANDGSTSPCSPAAGEEVETVTPSSGSGTDLAVNLTNAASTLHAGRSMTYCVTATDNGPFTATGVSVVLTLPSGVTVTNAGGGTVSANTVTWSVAKLLTGKHVNFKVTVHDTATSGTTLTATATVAGAGT